MSAWRRAHGWPDASLALLAAGQMIGDDEDEDEDEDDPAHFDSRDAYKRLANAGEQGDIVATAMSSETGQPVQLRPSDWTYGQLEFGNELDERLRVGSVVFSRITFRRTEVQSLWPREAPSTLPVTGAPGRPSSMYVVLAEFERRVRLSPPEVVQSVGKQAAILHDWFTANHNGLPPLTPKTIENRIRDRHREVSPRK